MQYIVDGAREAYIPTIKADTVFKADESSGSCTCVEVSFLPKGVILLDTQQIEQPGSKLHAVGSAALLSDGVYDQFIEEVDSGTLFKPVDAGNKDRVNGIWYEGSGMPSIELSVPAKVVTFTLDGDTITFNDNAEQPHRIRAGELWVPDADGNSHIIASRSIPDNRGNNVLRYDGLEWLLFVDAVRKGGFRRPEIQHRQEGTATVTQLITPPHPSMVHAFPLAEAA